MLLNFDKLVGEPKAILWQGKTYKVNEVTVELYLDVLAAQNADGDNMDHMVAVAEKLIPGFKAAGFPMRFIPKLMEFIMAQGDTAKNETLPTE